jgi:hypothetical protein
MVEKPEIKLSKAEQEAFDKVVLQALYQSLYASGKLTIEQVKYLENINGDYWL